MIIPPLPTEDERRRRKRERLERHARDLRELAAIGMDLARTANNQSFLAEAGPGVLGEISLAFARVSRAVRQTMALETEVEDALDAIDDPVAPAKPQDQPPKPRDRPTSDLPPDPVNPVRRVVKSDDSDSSVGQAQFRKEAREDLLGDLYDDLDADRLYARRKPWPIAKIVARVSRGIVIQPKNPLRTGVNGEIPFEARVHPGHWRDLQGTIVPRETQPPDG